MGRLRRTNARSLLIAFMVLDLGLCAYVETAGAQINAHTDSAQQQVAWLLIDAFLVWRVWRGGRIAWAILLVLNVIDLALLLVGSVSWTAYEAGLAAFVIAQTVILLTPAVRQRTVRSLA
jgi:hypothetical protein